MVASRTSDPNAGRPAPRGAPRLTDVTRPLVPIPLARGSHGAVVAPHHLATAAGLAILQAGGSAVDAAIATNAVLAVVDGNSCGIGGDAFWLIWDPAERAAARAQRLGPVGPRRGPRGAARGRASSGCPCAAALAITVPGAVRSWGDAHDRLRPAPAGDHPGAGHRARRGRLPGLGRVHRGGRGDARRSAARRSAADAAWFSVYRPHGRPWRPGERVRLPALAATLGRLADDGFDEFYDGEIAERQARGARGRRLGDHAARPRGAHLDLDRADRDDYRGVRVDDPPAEQLGARGPRDARTSSSSSSRRRPRRSPTGSGADARWVHLGIEAAKLAMADRDAHLTDPAFDYVAPSSGCSRRSTPRSSRRGSIRAGRACRRPPRCPVAAGTIWLGGRRRRRQRRSA